MRRRTLLTSRAGDDRVARVGRGRWPAGTAGPTNEAGGPANDGGSVGEEIAAFADEDAARPFAPGGIVFVGSSSIRLWDLRSAFPGRRVLNRGFGGTQIPDSVRHVERLALRHKPATVVFYAGDTTTCPPDGRPRRYWPTSRPSSRRCTRRCPPRASPSSAPSPALRARRSSTRSARRTAWSARGAIATTAWGSWTWTARSAGTASRAPISSCRTGCTSPEGLRLVERPRVAIPRLGEGRPSIGEGRPSRPSMSNKRGHGPLGERSLPNSYERVRPR